MLRSVVDVTRKGAGVVVVVFVGLVSLFVVLLNPVLAVLTKSSTVVGGFVVVVEAVVLFACEETTGNRGLVVTNVTGLFATVLFIFAGLIGSRLKTFTADKEEKLLLPVAEFLLGFGSLLLPLPTASVAGPTTSALLIRSADPLTMVGVLMTNTSLLMSSRS